MNRLQRRSFRCAAIAALGLAIAAPTQAALLEDFRLSDVNGAVITAAANNANAGNSWLSQNTAVESSVLNGSFRIQKASVTGQVGNTLNIANVTSGKAWLVAEIAGWSYTATASSPLERVRFGFLDNNDPPTAGSNTIAAEMTIDRIGSDLFLSGEALGTGSSNVAADLPLSLTRSSPLTIVLELDKILDQYSVYYQEGANPFVLLGTADLGASTLNAGDRDGNSLRFAFTGLFNDAGEFFDISRIYVTTSRPIPEPGSAAIVSVAAACLTLAQVGKPPRRV